MRSRYRFRACPENGCPKLRSQPGKCPEHDVEMVEVVLRREDAQDKTIRAEHTAKRVAEAGAKVGQAAGKPADPYGLASMFRGMAEDIELGRPPRHADIDLEDDDIEEDEDE